MTKRAAMLLIVFLHQTCTSTFYIHIVYNFIIMHDDSWSARHWTISATISDACLKFISKSSKTIMLIIIRHADFGQNTDFSFDPSLRRNYPLLYVFWSVRVPCSPHILLRFMIWPNDVAEFVVPKIVLEHSLASSMPNSIAVTYEILHRLSVYICFLFSLIFATYIIYIYKVREKLVLSMFP